MSTTEDCPPFRFIEFNPRRAGRGVEAARVQVDDDGEWLWMSKKDIRNNIRDFGWHPELQRALDAYDGKRTDAAQTSAMEG